MTPFDGILLLLWALVMLVGLVLELRALDERTGRPGGRSHADQWHHGWLGLVVIGYALAQLPPGVLSWGAGALVAGCALALLDDCVQHGEQTVTPGYESPLHRLYAWLLARIATRVAAHRRVVGSGIEVAR